MQWEDLGEFTIAHQGTRNKAFVPVHPMQFPYRASPTVCALAGAFIVVYGGNCEYDL